MNNKKRYSLLKKLLLVSCVVCNISCGPVQAAPTPNADEAKLVDVNAISGWQAYSEKQYPCAIQAEFYNNFKLRIRYNQQQDRSEIFVLTPWDMFDVSKTYQTDLYVDQKIVRTVTLKPLRNDALGLVLQSGDDIPQFLANADEIGVGLGSTLFIFNISRIDWRGDVLSRCIGAQDGAMAKLDDIKVFAGKEQQPVEFVPGKPLSLSKEEQRAALNNADSSIAFVPYKDPVIDQKQENLPDVRFADERSQAQIMPDVRFADEASPAPQAERLPDVRFADAPPISKPTSNAKPIEPQKQQGVGMAVVSDKSDDNRFDFVPYERPVQKSVEIIPDVTFADERTVTGVTPRPAPTPVQPKEPVVNFVAKPQPIEPPKEQPKVSEPPVEIAEVPNPPAEPRYTDIRRRPQQDNMTIPENPYADKDVDFVAKDDRYLEEQQAMLQARQEQDWQDPWMEKAKQTQKPVVKNQERFTPNALDDNVLTEDEVIRAPEPEKEINYFGNDTSIENDDLFAQDSEGQVSPQQELNNLELPDRDAPRGIRVSRNYDDFGSPDDYKRRVSDIDLMAADEVPPQLRGIKDSMTGNNNFNEAQELIDSLMTKITLLEREKERLRTRVPEQPTPVSVIRSCGREKDIIVGLQGKVTDLQGTQFSLEKQLELQEDKIASCDAADKFLLSDEGLEFGNQEVSPPEANATTLEEDQAKSAPPPPSSETEESAEADDTQSTASAEEQEEENSEADNSVQETAEESAVTE